MPSRIGFVGVGKMGANMALRLQDKGFTITALYDVNFSAAEELAKKFPNAKAVRKLTDVLENSDVIVTVVSDDAAMREIFLDETREDSLLKSGKSNGKLFLNCATVTPALHKEIEKAAQSVNASTLEACMASSIPQARNGTLYLMCAGQRAAFDSAHNILEALGQQIRYLGSAGKAAEVKALVNLVMNINTAGLAEGLGLADALGHDLNMIREVFSQTGANSRVLETDGEDMQNRSHESFFSAAHAAKDSGIAYQLGEDAKVTMPLAKATLDQYKKLVADGFGDLDKSAIAELTFPARGKR